MSADRSNIKADGRDLSFVTVKIVDANGNLVPDADSLIKFTVSANASIVGTDNGSETSMESFKATEHKAFNGLCLAVIQSKGKPGPIKLTATGSGLLPASVNIIAK